MSGKNMSQEDRDSIVKAAYSLFDGDESQFLNEVFEKTKGRYRTDNQNGEEDTVDENNNSSIDTIISK